MALLPPPPSPHHRLSATITGRTEHRKTHLISCGSKMASRSSIPSVRNLSLVEEEEQSSNLTLYPTSSPSCVPLSPATRCAMLVAATRRGWVTTRHLPFLANPASNRYCISCVQFPVSDHKYTIESTKHNNGTIIYHSGSILGL